MIQPDRLGWEMGIESNEKLITKALSVRDRSPKLLSAFGRTFYCPIDAL
jgi:hypothetical protein